MRTTLAACLFAALAGALLAILLLRRPEHHLPETPAVLEQVRRAARLETLDARLYKKIDFAPEPDGTDSLWAGVAEWARFTLRAPRGKAIVFAIAHLSIDLRALDERSLRVSKRAIVIALPRLETRVELLPAETEILGSNLDSAETAQLFALAKSAFEREVAQDAALSEAARAAAREDLRRLLSPLGYTDVTFVEALPAPALD